MLYRDYIPNSLLTTMPKQVELNVVSEVQEWTTKTAVWSKRRYHLLGGSGGLRMKIMGINGVAIWVIGVINLLTKSP